MILTIGGRVGENLDGGIVEIKVVNQGAVAAETGLQIRDHLLQRSPVGSVDVVAVNHAAQRVLGTGLKLCELCGVAPLRRRVAQEEQPAARIMKPLPEFDQQSADHSVFS